MTNVAKDLLWPKDKDIIVRVVFLYVGQGDSTIVLAANGGSYETILIDINLDSNNGGIDVPHLMSDLLEDRKIHLNLFVNTHPHNDHLLGIKELSEKVEIGEVWHSGHKPGKDHKDAYESLKEVIKKVKESGGSETELNGSKELRTFGEAEYYVLAPASYVVDDIEGESGEERYRRIHEQCAVLKFGKEPKWVMITGDSDRDAWEKHITHYHKERLSSAVLSAPHHGSRSFFRYQEEDEPYLDALHQISPTYVVVSAPTSEESPHGHPHDDAISLYIEQVKEDDNVLHTGKHRHSFICDIFRDGELTIQEDNGALAEKYGLVSNDETSQKKSSIFVPPVVSHVDSRPMGS
ncbi:ComEC/Rec2 family competence protein [Chloroflexota bacterium]